MKSAVAVILIAITLSYCRDIIGSRIICDSPCTPCKDRPTNCQYGITQDSCGCCDVCALVSLFTFTVH
ncbi:hypothetical protein CHUAL_009961 [Chamberlinius hualienensis]